MCVRMARWQARRRSLGILQDPSRRGKMRTPVRGAPDSLLLSICDDRRPSPLYSVKSARCVNNLLAGRWRLVHPHQAAAVGHLHRLGTAGDAQLLEEMTQVGLHGTLGDAQVGGDLLVG